MAEKVIIDLEPQIKDSLKIASQIEAKEKSILSLVKDRVSTLAKGAASGVKGVAGGIAGAAAGAGKAVGGAGLSSFAAMTSGGPIAGIAAIGGPLAALGTAFAGITSAVEKANPAAMSRLQEAISDFIGVIGQALTPIVDAATVVVREFGSIFATMMPTFRPIIDKFAKAITEVAVPILGMFGDYFIQVFEAIMPLVEPVLQWFVEILRDYLVPGMNMAVEATKYLVNALISFYNYTSDIVKRLTFSMVNLGRMQQIAMGRNQVQRLSSIGASVREAQMTGIAEFGAQAQIQAWRASIDPANRTAAATEAMVNMMRRQLSDAGQDWKEANKNALGGGM